MRPAFSDLMRVTLKRCEHDDAQALGRQGATMSGGDKVRLSHGVRFQQASAAPRLEVRCSFAEDRAQPLRSPRAKDR